MKRLVFDPARCSLCGACLAACSAVKKGRIDFAQSRIRIETAGSRKPLRAAVCAHCEEPACVTACMRGIIDKGADGLVTRRWEECFRCAACLVSCPVGAVLEDTDRKAFIACDLCGKAESGEDPLCVRVCLSGALRFEEETAASADLRSSYALQMFAEKPAAPADPTDGQWEEIARMIAEECGSPVTVKELKSAQEQLRRDAEEGM
ncbi:MAG: hypothetical protein K5772_02795 [Clostridia bacterium]|nr:hypothetical protein [Clostridia bacterium]